MTSPSQCLVWFQYLEISSSPTLPGYRLYKNNHKTLLNSDLRFDILNEAIYYRDHIYQRTDISSSGCAMRSLTATVSRWYWKRVSLFPDSTAMSHQFLLNSKLVPRLCADKFADLFKQIQMPILIGSSLNINSLQNIIISRKTKTYLLFRTLDAFYLPSVKRCQGCFQRLLRNGKCETIAQQKKEQEPVLSLHRTEATSVSVPNCKGNERISKAVE